MALVGTARAVQRDARMLRSRLRAVPVPGPGPVALTFTFALALASSGCSGGPGGTQEALGSTSEAVSGSAIVSLALANVGGMACAKNSLGGHAFESSCTGNGGQPEYWCADFAQWVWANSGVDTTGLDAAAGSFYVYGQKNGTLSNTPVPGAAVVFDYQGGGVADHVAIVTQVNSNGTIESVSGDWGGQSGSEATFSSTSHVVLNSPAYASAVGGTPSVIGMTISGYIQPKGGLSLGYAAKFVSQSFPLATTALKMTAGETLPAYIEMKNTGGKAWDSSTRLGTTQPRDRKSAFADSTWISPNRLAAVKGTVAPGATYKFQFDLHAPTKPGTYFEYFNLVEENVAWFSDPGQGGPPDNDLEVQIEVVAAPPSHDAGTDGASHVGGDGGSGSDGGEGASSGSGSSSGGEEGPDAGEVLPGDDGGTAGGNGFTGSSGGCTASSGGAGGTSAAWLAAAAAAMVASRRRRSR